MKALKNQKYGGVRLDESDGTIALGRALAFLLFVAIALLGFYWRQF